MKAKLTTRLVAIWKTKGLAIWKILTGQYRNFILLNVSEGIDLLNGKRLVLGMKDRLTVDMIQVKLNNDQARTLFHHLTAINPSPFSSKDYAETEVTAVKRQPTTLEEVFEDDIEGLLNDPSRTITDVQKDEDGFSVNLKPKMSESQYDEAVMIYEERNKPEIQITQEDGTTVTMAEAAANIAMKFDNSEAQEAAYKYQAYRHYCMNNGIHQIFGFTQVEHVGEVTNWSWVEHDKYIRSEDYRPNRNV